MSYLFIKNLFKEKSLYYFHKKYKKFKKPKKNILSGFFRLVFLGGFLGGFFWVGFILPTLPGVG